MNGLKMTIKYGIIPCRLNLCGPKKDKISQTALLNFLSGVEKNENKIREILQQFKGATTCYKQIAQVNGIADIFDYRVVEAYWLGNDLLQNCSDCSAHHTFQVYYIYDDESLSGLMPFSDELKNICRIGWGIVTKLHRDNNTIEIEYQPIIRQNNRLTLDVPKLKIVKWDKSILPIVHIGDCVSLHWNHAIEVLDETQQNNLQKWTLISLQPLV